MTNILYEIDNQYPYLTKNEKKIANYIQNAPHEVIKMNSQDLAQELDTSPSSIIRFSKKLVEGGFQELKIELSRYMPKETTVYNVELVDNESTSSLKKKMLARANGALNKANNHLNDKTVDLICDQFKHSKRIFIYGYGASFVVATDLYQKLSRIGMNAQLAQETHIFTTMLASCDSRDCVVFITNNGAQSEMQSIAKVVEDYHIPIVTITSSPNNTISKMSDIILDYGETDENEMRMGATTSLFAQMFTIDVLYYRYIALNYQSSLDFITQSKMALDNYRKHLSNIDFKH